MDETERFFAKYDEMGEDEVRSKLNLGIISGRGIAPAEEWLRRRDVAREAQERSARETASAEDRRTARSAKNAAWAAAIAAIIAAIAAVASAVIAFSGDPS